MLRKNLKYHWSGWIIVLMILLLFGCSQESDTRLVDFNKTIPVAKPGEKVQKRPTLKVAVAAMVSPKETFACYRKLLDYMAAHLDMEVELIQRKTYVEINDLIGKGQIDVAFICSGPYSTGKEQYGLELLATPEVRGSHFYQAYLIVNVQSSFKNLEELRGHVFAFTDPDSNTGKLIPSHWLAQIHEQAQTFFGKTIYTYSHDNSILAVSKGLVDGAAVDGLVWEYYHRKNPSYTENTRIIKKSEPYGIPPVVASKKLPVELKERVKKLLLSMHDDPSGRKILEELLIDRFVEPREDWYDGIRQMMQVKSFELKK